MSFNKLTLLLFFSTGLLSSCNKDEPPRPYWGDTSTYLNGKVKEFYPSAEISEYNEETITLSLKAYTDEWLLKQHFYVVDIPLKEGTHYFNRAGHAQITPKFLILQVNGDSSYGTYNLSDKDGASFITINKIKDDKIWGTFEATLYRDSLSDTSTPEVFNFTAGKFKTRILQ